MSSISEIYRVRQRAIAYAIKHNNNSKAAVKYKTSRQQIKRWRDRYDGTVQSLLPKSRRPKSHPNQHTQEEIELVMKKYRKFGYEGLAEVYVKARKEGYTRTYDSMCKIIKKIKGNAKEKLKKQHKRKKKVEQAKYPGERVQIDIKYVPEECIQFGTRDQKYLECPQKFRLFLSNFLFPFFMAFLVFIWTYKSYFTVYSAIIIPYFYWSVPKKLLTKI